MFKAELYNLIRHLAGDPASIMQMIVVLALGIVVCVLVFEKLNSVLGTPLTGIGLSAIVLLIAAIVLIVSVVSVKLWLVPDLSSAALRASLPFVTALAVLLVIVIPLFCFVQKAKYFQALLCLALSVCAASAVILLANACYDAAGVVKSKIGEAGSRTGDALKQ